MSNIQKEISQLEHWLTNLPDDTSPAVAPPPTSTSSDDAKYVLLKRIADQVHNQQLTLSNILERLDILEGCPRADREVFINEEEDEDGVRSPADPWLDNNCVPLQNELVGDNVSEPLYTVHKASSTRSSSVATPSIIPDVPEDNSIPPEINSDDEEDDEGNSHATQPVVIVEKLGASTVKEEEAEAEEEEEEAAEEEAEEEEAEEEEQAEEEEAEEEEEEEAAEEEEAEEEEEEGVELEEIEYKNTRYYKDAENFIYSIDENDEPSENPVGYWKEKTETIAFYKTK
jgi:hypothetical protein